MENGKDEERDRVIKAFGIAKNNSYMRCLFGDTQLFYMFMEGMKFQKTGEMPKDLLDDPEFLNNPEKYRK